MRRSGLVSRRGTPPLLPPPTPPPQLPFPPPLLVPPGRLPPQDGRLILLLIGTDQYTHLYTHTNTRIHRGASDQALCIFIMEVISGSTSSAQHYD